MARIAGVDIPREKRVDIALTYIFGIGRSTAVKICEECNLPGQTKVKDLTDDELAKIRSFIDKNMDVEGDLRTSVRQNIRRKMEIGSYQGIRHRRGLPVRGQITKKNARTRKGPKKTIAGKKKAPR